MNEKSKMMVDIVKDLALLLMEQEGMTMEQALFIVLNSDTYRKVQNEQTRLYYQSPRYIFSFLETELKKGKPG